MAHPRLIGRGKGYRDRFFLRYHPIIQALIATCFTWIMTALGASFVFFTGGVSRKLLDTMLGFAAGAMIFVVIEEVIPESQAGGNTDIATLGAIAGFVVMMILDTAFH